MKSTHGIPVEEDREIVPQLRSIVPNVVLIAWTNKRYDLYTAGSRADEQFDKRVLDMFYSLTESH